MDVSTNEFRFSRADSNVSKFTRYSKNVAPPSSSKIKDELAIPSETGDSKKKHFRYTSACDIKTNPLYIPQLDRLSPKMPQNLTTVFSSLELRSISSSVSNGKSKLTVLDLSNTNLTAFPVDIFDYSSLRILRLDHNNIKEIPLEITNFSKLETLTISFNKLVCLPRTISNLTFLQELNLESNTIETISDEICGLKALKALNLCHNRLGYMPCSLKDLVSLVEFNSEWFHYTKPRLCALQKGKEGVYNINKMRNKMVDLAKRKVKGMTFKYFLEFFSTEKINFTDIDGLGRSILHYASLNQDLSVIRYLCTSLPELKNVQDKEDLTPFGLCLLKDKFKSCEYLLAQGIDLTKGIGKFGSLLHVATKKLHLPLVKQLIFTGSDLLTIDSLGNTPLHYAVTSMVDSYNKSVPIVQFLLENSVNPNAKNKENWTPLHLVARKGAIQPLEWIINYNLEVKEVYGGDQLFKLDKRGGAFKWTPLHIAGYTGASKMIQILGDAGADFFKTSAHGYKPKAMIRRPGLPLKLIEKFEKDFIKKNILKKKRIYTRNFTCHTVQSPSHTREIHNASKNKFKESYSSLNLLHLSKQEPSRLGMSFFGRSTNGLIFNSPPSKIHSKRQIDDSVEITPETETGLADSLDGNLLTEMEAAENIGLDSESVDVGADLYLLGGPMSDKTTNGLFNTSQAWQNKSIKQKNNTNLFFFTDLNLETYKHKVNNPKVFALEDLKDELEFLAESLTSTKLALSEKMKLLLALRVLHSAIIDHIYRKFTVPVRKESLPAYAMNSSGWRSPRGNSILGLKRDDQQIIFFYDQVPQRLISAYWALENKDPKNMVLKQNICKMLGDMKYLSGVEFLQRVMDTKNENPMVIMEAKCARTMLNTQIQLNEPQKVNQDFLKKQYAKTLHPKANFSLKAPL